MATLLIQNGIVLDPAQKLERKADVLVRDGRIAAIGTNLGKADRVTDAAGCYVTPGLIDIHVHLREPGDEEEETIASGAAAAVAGGVTAGLCLAQTQTPPGNRGGG